jgi:lipase chaperone LimK
MQSYPKTLTLALLIVASSAGLWYRIQGNAVSALQAPAHITEVDVPQDTTRPVRASNEAHTTQHPQAMAITMPRLPNSLQGSMPDGEVTLGADGRVQPSLGLRRLFDYFLSSIGELDLKAIRAQLIAYVRTLHGPIAAHEVGAWFDRYVDYQQALAAAEPTLAGALEERLAFARQLRRRFFDGASAEIFFGEEEAYAEYTLERMRIGRDLTLTEAKRAERLRSLEATLSSEQRTSLRVASTALIAEEQSRQFEALHLDGAKRLEERSALFGAAAATRLADLDLDRAAWQQRLQAYVQARDRLRNHPDYADAQRTQLISQLRARRFDANEIRRIQSLEAIGQL